MNAPTLFDEEQMVRATKHAGDVIADARARWSDPEPSHLAARIVQPGNGDLIKAIKWYASKKTQPVSAFDIADALCGPRWQHDTVRSAVSRSGLVEHKNACRTPGGRLCNGYTVEA